MGGETVAAPAASAGTEKMLRKLQRSVEAGNYYEALEMCKSVAARYTTGRKFSDALTLLQESARTQLQFGQVNNGVELALQMVDVLAKSASPVSDATLARVEAVAACFPIEREPAGAPSHTAAISAAGCARFLRAALKWSRAHGGGADGAPRLNVLLADFLWRTHGTDELFNVCKHLILAAETDRLAQVLREASSAGGGLEVDLFVVRGVLLCLCHRRLSDARRLYEAFLSTAAAPSSTALAPTPLTNFVDLLLQALEKHSPALVDVLRECYRPSLERDPMMLEYVDEVRRSYFPAGDAAGGMAGMLGRLLGATGDG